MIMIRTTLHIICGDSRSRAEQARIAFALGQHAEVYGELDELIERLPSDGLILAADDGSDEAAERVIGSLADAGIWLPVVFTASEPEIERVVAAIKAGALDYLALPLEMGGLARRLDAILAEAGQHADRRRQEVEAQQAIALLSRREREVLELLSAGCSNKEIARTLEISPRTVEIHRGNMMTKLGAGHPADAVRLWLTAEQEATVAPKVEASGEGDRGLRVDARTAARRARIGRRRQRQ